MPKPPTASPPRSVVRPSVVVPAVVVTLLVTFGLLGPVPPSDVGAGLADAWRLVVNTLGFPCAGV